MAGTQRNIWLVRGAWASLVASFLVLGIKYYAYILTGSVAVLSDALESIINVLTAMLALWVIRYVAEPADEEHPYGHGKMEYFSAAFEGGLITFAALAISIEAIRSFFSPSIPQDLDSGVYLTAFATFLNWSVGASLLWIAKTKKSEALRASGVHLMSDVITSVGAVLGLAVVGITGYAWADPAAAILIAGYLGYSGYGIVRKSVGALIDEVDLKVIEEFTQALKKASAFGASGSSTFEAIDFHNVRLIRSGHFHHADAHVVLPEFWTVHESHEVSTALENRMKEFYPYDLEVAFHVDPCLRKYCSGCSLSSCQIRQEPFLKKREWTAKELILGPPAGRE